MPSPLGEDYVYQLSRSTSSSSNSSIVSPLDDINFLEDVEMRCNILALQTEHAKLWKRSKSSKTVDQAQEIIDALQAARDTIANDPHATQVTLAKLQTPVKASFDNINAGLKEVYGGLNKYTRALDKLFKDKSLPSSEIDALTPYPTLLTRAIYLHFLREGLFDVASTFSEEVSAKFPDPQNHDISNGTTTDGVDGDEVKEQDRLLRVDKMLPEEMEKQFEAMYHILHAMKEERNLGPAIAWARAHSRTLEARGSNLEFELCRLEFADIFQGHDEDDSEESLRARQYQAINYARNEFQAFHGRYLLEIRQLMGALAYGPNLEESPYRNLLHNSTGWDEVANSFTREFCSLLELSADSPLYIAATAGAIALPTLVKLQNIMQQKRTEWTTANELPAEIPLPPAYQFHSIFVCPVSKEQTTDQNPPMMMPCGHVIAQESLMRLSKGSRFKCPYCPSESHPRDARKVFL